MEDNALNALVDTIQYRAVSAGKIRQAEQLRQQQLSTQPPSHTDSTAITETDVETQISTQNDNRIADSHAVSNALHTTTSNNKTENTSTSEAYYRTKLGATNPLTTTTTADADASITSDINSKSHAGTHNNITVFPHELLVDSSRDSTISYSAGSKVIQAAAQHYSMYYSGMRGICLCMFAGCDVFSF